MLKDKARFANSPSAGAQLPVFMAPSAERPFAAKPYHVVPGLGAWFRRWQGPGFADG